MVHGRLGGVRVGRMTPASHVSQALHNSQASKDGPDEEAKGDGSLDGLAASRAVAVGDANLGSHGDGAAKPEDSGDGEQAEGGDAVVEAGGEEGRQGQVEQDDDGPDRVEEHKGKRRRGIAPAMKVGDVDSWARVSVVMVVREPTVRTYHMPSGQAQ